MPTLIPSADSSIVTLIHTMAVANWNPLFTVSSPGNGLATHAWDNYNNRWVHGLSNPTGSTTAFAASHDGGQTWKQIISSASVLFPGITAALAFSPVTGFCTTQQTGTAGFGFVGQFDSTGAGSSASYLPIPTTAAVDYFIVSGSAFQIYGVFYDGTNYSGSWLTIGDTNTAAGGIVKTTSLPSTTHSGVSFRSGASNP